MLCGKYHVELSRPTKERHRWLQWHSTDKTKRYWFVVACLLEMLEGPRMCQTISTFLESYLAYYQASYQVALKLNSLRRKLASKNKK